MLTSFSDQPTLCPVFGWYRKLFPGNISPGKGHTSTPKMPCTAFAGHLGPHQSQQGKEPLAKEMKSGFEMFSLNY